MKIYYRGFWKKLHAFEVSEPMHPGKAIDLVRKELKNTGEHFTEPLLALIKGGKA